MLPIYLLTGTYFLRENQIHLNCSSFLHQIDEQKLCKLFLTGGGSFCVHLVGKNQMKESQETEKLSIFNLHR